MVIYMIGMKLMLVGAQEFCLLFFFDVGYSYVLRYGFCMIFVWAGFTTKKRIYLIRTVRPLVGSALSESSKVKLSLAMELVVRPVFLSWEVLVFEKHHTSFFINFDGCDYLLVLFGMFCSVRFRLEDMVLTDTEALAARRDLADRLKQREYQMAVDADMEVGYDQVKTHKFLGVSIASY